VNFHFLRFFSWIERCRHDLINSVIKTFQ
jgi:hypothetical protein